MRIAWCKCFLLLLLMPVLACARTQLSPDFNHDGKVDGQDLSLLLSNWGSTTRPVEDINQDGTVNLTDLGILLSNWGTVTNPTAPAPTPLSTPREGVGAELDSPVPAGAIVLSPGADLQAAVNNAPGGSIFYLKAGVYRLQSVVPKSGDSFVGEYGAILNGSKVLTTFGRSGSHWVATGQTQEDKYRIGVCDPSAPRCAYPEDLFFDDKPLLHVASLSAVGPGKWYFDYAADIIYFSDDPRGHKVETSVQPNAFSWKNGESQVTIKNLIIEKYASPGNRGAIGDFYPSSGQGWIVDHVESRLNHGVGIVANSYGQVTHSYIHHNGQFGMGASGSVGALIEGNELAYNNDHSWFSTSWGAGAAKFALTTNLTVRGNYVHHNDGSFGTDIENRNTVYEYNHLAWNTGGTGIVHEISYDAVIRYNTIENIASVGSWLWGNGCIIVNTSINVQVYGNTMTNCGDGITLMRAARGNGSDGLPFALTNVFVHDNTVTNPTYYAAGLQHDAASNDSVYTSSSNRFEANTYGLSTAGRRYYYWMNAAQSVSGWKGYGNDVNGVWK